MADSLLCAGHTVALVHRGGGPEAMARQGAAGRSQPEQSFDAFLLEVAKLLDRVNHGANVDGPHLHLLPLGAMREAR